jgi:type I restriction enzyme M protein
VLFLHVDNDGYKLDANHDTPIEADDLPELVSFSAIPEPGGGMGGKRDPKAPWHEKWWFADAPSCAPTSSICQRGGIGR